MLRQLVFGQAALPFDDAGVATIVRALGFGPDTMHHIAQALQGKSILQSINVPSELGRAVADAHSHTWVTTQGLRPIVEVRAGSRPGDPLGDIVFKILESHVHLELAKELGDTGTILSLPPVDQALSHPSVDNITRSVFFNNYVDDDAFGIVGRTPKQLMTHVSHTAAAVARVSLRHGLALNFKPNKTELLVCMNGPGSKKAMSDLIITSDSKVTIPGPSISPGAPDVSLRACAWYRHMGICCSPSAKGFSREAKARSGAMFAALKDIRRRVVRNPRLETSTRLGLCESLLFSQLFYASSLWHNEPAGAVTSINHAYLAPLREVMQMRNVDEDGVAKQSCDRTSNAQVLVAAQLPTALGWARAARIKYWCRLTRQAPPLLVHLALSCWQVPSTWSYEVAADLRRIWAQGGHRVQGLPDPMIEPRPWMEAVRLNDNGFNKMLVRTVLTWHNPSVGPAVVGAQAEQLEQTCPECSRVFHHGIDFVRIELADTATSIPLGSLFMARSASTAKWSTTHTGGCSTT